MSPSYKAAVSDVCFPKCAGPAQSVSGKWEKGFQLNSK